MNLVISDSYGLKAGYLELISWGYHTTAYYVKTSKNRDLLLAESAWSADKEAKVGKDISIALYLDKKLPVPRYLPTKQKGLQFTLAGKIYRLSEFAGLSPLKMDYHVLGQMLAILKKLHHISPPATLKSKKVHTNQNEAHSFLHGDPTPHNFLVTNNKLSAMLDFELCYVGRIEEDLGKCIVFSWNYMHNRPFEEVYRYVIDSYSRILDQALVYKEALTSLQNHLASVLKHKDKYSTRTEWERDFTFTNTQLNRLKEAGRTLVGKG